MLRFITLFEAGVLPGITQDVLDKELKRAEDSILSPNGITSSSEIQSSPMSFLEEKDE